MISYYIPFGGISGVGRAFYTKNSASWVYNTARCCSITVIFLLAERFAIVMRMSRFKKNTWDFEAA